MQLLFSTQANITLKCLLFLIKSVSYKNSRAGHLDHDIGKKPLFSPELTDHLYTRTFVV